MEHLVFFFHIVSFMFGCVTIVLSYLLYMKYKRNVVKYYTLFLVSLTAILLERTFTYYEAAGMLSEGYINVIFWVISCLGSGLMMYALPFFTYELLQLHLSEGRKQLFYLLSFLPIISLVLYYALPYKLMILNIINLVIFLTLVYCICLAGFLLKSVESKETAKIIKTFLMLFGLWLPLVFMDFRLQQMPAFQKVFPYGLLTIPLFYLALNSFTLYYGHKYFGVFVSSPMMEEQSNALMDKADEEAGTGNLYEQYKFTAREIEVIHLLIQGCSYQKISEELMISFATARTHGYNIYKKAGVSNKVELANLMKQNHR